jgi:hypothetical protein
MESQNGMDERRTARPYWMNEDRLFLYRINQSITNIGQEGMNVSIQKRKRVSFFVLDYFFKYIRRLIHLTCESMDHWQCSDSESAGILNFGSVELYFLVEW